jgi:hypothetical protein
MLLSCRDLGSFSAGYMLQTEAHVLIPFPCEDQDVMIILLHIIHGQVSFVTLTKVAAAVNYHNIQEAVEIFLDIWIETLNESTPTRYVPEVSGWLFIFWVFQKKDGFSNMTWILQQECSDNLEAEADFGPNITAFIISMYIVLLLR